MRPQRDSKGHFIKGHTGYRNSGNFVKGEARLIGNTYAKGNKPNSTSFKEGVSVSPNTQFKKGIIPWNKGTRTYKYCECGVKLCDNRTVVCRKCMVGEKAPRWAGGITKPNARLAAKRRKGVKRLNKIALIRDKYACVLCGSNERLEVDHIKPIAHFPDLVLSIDNLRTLCHECHKLTETYGGKIKKLTYV